MTMKRVLMIAISVAVVVSLVMLVMPTPSVSIESEGRLSLETNVAIATSTTEVTPPQSAPSIPAGGRWVSPGWNDGVVNVVEYNDGSYETHVDFDTVAWGEVAKAGLRLLPSQQVCGFNAKYGFLLWYPNYQFYDKPVMRCFVRFWGERPQGWLKVFLAGDTINKTPYYNETPYVFDHLGEPVDAYTKELGWSGTQTILGKDIPFYIGQKADLLSEELSIKTSVTTPVDLSNTALEYIFVVDPDLDIAEKIEFVRIWLDTGEVDEWGNPIYETQDIPLNQIADKSGTLPDMLKHIAFVLPSGEEIAFFNFQDIWDTGIEGHWLVDQITLPSGENTWALHIGEEFGALSADETLEVDPGWVSPTGHNDPDSKWYNEAQAYDEDEGAAAGNTKDDAGYYFELTHAALWCDKVRIKASDYDSWPNYVDYNPNIDIDVYYSSAWHNIFSGVITANTWVEKAIGSTQSVTKARIKFNTINYYVGLIYEFDFWETEPPCSEDISNTPAAWSVNGGTPLLTSSEYVTGLAFFEVTNNSGGSVSISISGTDMDGATNDWTLSNTATAGVETYGLKAGISGGAYTIVVKKNTPYNNLTSSLADTASQDWGLKLYTPTQYASEDTETKEATVTLTATCI